MVPRVVVVKKSSAWWKVLLGFLGGFILGIGTVAGIVAGVGAGMKTKDIISLTGADADKILTSKYQEMTILDIVLEAVGGNIKIQTLGDIAEITPLIDSYVEEISTQLNELGTSLTKEEIYTWPFSEIPDHLIESVKQVELVSFLSKGKEDNPDPIVKYICYQTDEHGEYVIQDGKLVPQVLADMLDNGSYLQNKLDTMKIKVLFTEAEINNSPLLKAIKDKTIKELSEDGAFDDIQIASVVSEDNNSKIIEAFRRDEVTIGGIDDAIDNLYLDDVFEYDNYDELPSVLKKLLAKDSYGTAPGQEVTTNPYTLTKMILSGGYPMEYDYVIFSDGTDENKTDYIPFSKIVSDNETGFINKATININNDKTVTFSGSEVRDINSLTVTININKPTSWEHLYALSCNKPAKVKDLDSAIDSLKLKDVMQIKPTDSLWKVRNENITNGEQLFESIKNNLLLQDILPDYQQTKLLKALPGDTLIADIADAINYMKLVDAFEDNIFDPATGKMDKMWKYMLIEADEPWINGDVYKTSTSHPLEGYACMNYTVGGDGQGTNPKGIDQLIVNMKENMNRATIRQLNQDQIVDLNSSFVEGTIPFYFQAFVPASAQARGATKYGDLTIDEFAQMISSYSPAP